MTKLTTLQLQNNEISDIEELRNCPTIKILDLSNNKISDGEQTLDILAGMPELRCLYLKGNPVVQTIKNYRRTVISRLKTLAFLDDRPVKQLERRLIAAWYVTPFLSLMYHFKSKGYVA